MLRGKKKRYAFGLIVGLLLGTSLFVNPTVFATEGDSTEGTIVLTDVDTSKGITYIYNEEDTEKKSPIGINLNGNSVIIVESANSTSEKMLNNFYIDTDRDGIIDEGETMATVDGSTDVIAGPSVYGVYQQITTTPISVTISSGFAPVVYCVYQGEMDVENSTGIAIRLYGGNVPGTLFGAYESKIMVDGARAIDIVVDTESTTSTSTVMGAYKSSVDLKNADVTGINIQYNKGVVGSTYVLNETPYTTTNCSGTPVNIDIIDGTYNYFVGAQSGAVTSDGTATTLMDFDISGGTMSAAYGSCYADLNAGKNTNTALDIDITGSAVVSNYFYGVNGTYNSETEKNCIVVGNIDVNCNPTAIPDSGYNLYNFYATNYYVDVDGSVNAYVNNVRSNNIYMLNYYTSISGDFTYETGSNIDICYNYGMYSAKAGGDVTLNLYGSREESTNTYGGVYGVYGSYNDGADLVGGNFTFNYKGGKAPYLYGAYGYNNSSLSAIKGWADINIEKGTFNTVYGVSYASVGKDMTFDFGENCVTSNYVYVSYYGSIQGNVISNTYNANSSTTMPYYYGVYYSDVAGNVTSVVDGGYYTYLYGVYGKNKAGIGGDVDITFKNINKDAKPNYSYTTYGTSYTNIAGDVKVTISDSNFPYLYGTDDCASNGNVSVNINNVNVDYYLYAAEVQGVTGNIECNVKDVTANGLYGVYMYNGGCGGTIDCKISNATVKDYLYGLSGGNTTIEGDVKVEMDNCSSQYLYAVNSVNIDGNLDLDVIGGTYGSTTYNNYIYGCSSATTKGTTDVSFTNTTINGSLEPYYNYGSGKETGDIDVSLDGVTLVKVGDYNSYLYNCLAEGEMLNMQIADNCVLPEDVEIDPSTSGYGEAIASYDGAKYYAGRIAFTEDFTLDTLYLTSGYYYIPKDVTVKVNKELYYQEGRLLLEGTLDATFAGTTNDEGKYSAAMVYFNGGTMTQDVATLGALYYPLDVEYLEKGGNVSLSTNYVKHPFGGEQYYSCYGTGVTVKTAANEGYSVTGVTLTAEGDANPTDIVGEEGSYTFTMGNKPTVVNITFTGDTIVLGKTVADPVVKSGETYTEENPVYDLSTVSISNDSAEGEVTYAVDETYSLPTGLELKDGKICGSTTEVNESGKKVVILVTGKNGNVAELTLNMVVTEGEGIQTNQDGRITVDSENKMIYLSGNSVVLSGCDEGTAIYLDDDKDGEADYETAVYTGDLSEYTIYGIRNSDSGNKVRITVNGGSVLAIYGAQNGNLTNEDCGLEFYMNGGSVASFHALSDAKATGTMKLVVTESITNLTTYEVGTGTYSSKGYYKDNKGEVIINGVYTVDGDITATSVTTNKSSDVEVTGEVNVTTLTLGESGTAVMGGAVTATTVVINNYSESTFEDVVTVGTLTVNSYSEVTFDGIVDASKSIYLYSNQGTVFNKDVTTEEILYMNSAVVTFNGEVDTVDLTINNSSTDATFNKDVTVRDVFYTNGHTRINSGVTVTVATYIDRHSSSRVYLKGTLAPTKQNYSYGCLYMMDGGVLGTLSSGSWSNIYYPVTTSTDMDKTSLVVNSYQSVTEGNTTSLYACGGDTNSVTATAVQGYTYEFTIGDAEPVASDTNTYMFTMPKAVTNVSVKYVPIPITVQKRFAEPVGVKDTEYTAAQPLYDLTDLIISNDTTKAYGTDMKYAVANGSTLPEGLSLVDGQVVGIPIEVNEEGTTVTFEVTGRNGTTTAVDVLFVIKDADYAPTDVNDDVTVSYRSINLNGHSVVIYEDFVDSTLCSIYPDYDRDGEADNNIPLKIDDATSYNLGSYNLYGYSNTKEAYEGDISITMKGGKMSCIYGVCGTTSTKAEVNGTVAVYIYGGTVANRVYGAYYADVDNVDLDVTGGTHAYTYFYGAYNSQVNEDVNLECGGTAILKASNYSYTYVYATYGGTVAGDVNMTLGAKDSTYGFTGKCSCFRGVYSTDVTGNVNCTVDGYFYPQQWSTFAQNSTIGKDMNVTLKSGYLYAVYSAQKSTIAGDVNIIEPEDATIQVNTIYALESSKAKNVYAYVPSTAKYQINTLTLMSGTTAGVEGTAYAYNKGYVTIGGEYVFTDDLSAYTMNVLPDAKVTIMEGVSVTMSSSYSYIREGATVVNEGTFTSSYIYNYGTVKNNGTMTVYYNDNYGNIDNYGSLKTTGNTYVETGAIMTNHEGATWTVAGRIINSAKIYNYGEFVQTYTSSYYHQLGTIYSTNKLTLSRESGYASYYISNSNIYYPYDVDYPSHCVETVDFASEYTASSGMEGDDNVYIKAGTTFTVTPGEKLSSAVVLDTVSYGSTPNYATKNTDGTWTGTVPLEPFTVTLNYIPAEDVEDITLGITEDRVENTEDSTPLIVNKTYYTSSPLYDLTQIEIIGDTEEDGVVTYTLDSGSTLPDGMYLKDGKLYGTLKTATTTDHEMTFVIKGKNQTSTFFTLTLGPVKQALPSWTVPTNLQASAGGTYGDIYIGYSSYGTYSWPDATATVGDSIATLTDQTLYFTPTDTANYDWATVAENQGATYSNGKVTCKVSIKVYASKPTYTVPEKVTATYGQTFGEVEIPAGDNEGTFSWEYDSATKVGSVGSYYRYVTYTPNDTDQYQSVNRIKVLLVVERAVPTYDKVASLTSVCGVTLADIELPDVEGGKYHWITTDTTIVSDGKTYQLGFKPTDTYNYDWTALEDGTWNTAWGSAVFPVEIVLTHSQEEKWSHDETHHWHECPVEKCGADLDKAEHVWDDGQVVIAATESATGTKVYTCDCGATKTEIIPMLAHTKHTYATTWSYDETTHWHACTNASCDEVSEEAEHVFDAGVVVVEATEEEEGTKKYTCTTCAYSYEEAYDIEESEDDEPLEIDEEFEDEENQITYMVTAEDEVEFVESVNASATEITVPESVTFAGQTYRITSIADEAFKNHKTLKKIKIGSNIKQIGNKAFYGCKKLTTVTMGNNVETIGNSAFQNCTALKKITIPAKVKKIGSKAFYGCKKLTNITIKTTKLNTKNVGKNAFKNAGSSNYKKLVVKVPKKKLKAYKTMLKKRGLSSKAKVKK
ncbi:MAG: leucine-rich repeat domain-containing protein [Lachnospiraceae bacterium]|nr:leucine-rich repeat domain-containing protein [Lachnospiraceae bacterium]